MTAAALLLALGVEWTLAWPDRLHRRIGHPVVWIGALIAHLDRATNVGPPRRRLIAGAATTGLTVGAAAAAGAAFEALLPSGVLGLLLASIFAWPLIAARSLHDHVAPVGAALAADDLPLARREVAKIVGRDPERLDEAGVARAAIESLAENFSDGVAAPLFWGLLLGLPGLAGYKAVNTLDSMIGHRTPRHAHFGRVAARLDDLVNLAPARLSALLIAIASGRPRAALAVTRRDARRHRSPNAGWPEAAMAGALGRRLSGPRAYAEEISDEPWLNEGALDPAADDVARALAIHRRALLLLAAALAGLSLAA